AHFTSDILQWFGGPYAGLMGDGTQPRKGADNGTGTDAAILTKTENLEQQTTWELHIIQALALAFQAGRLEPTDLPYDKTAAFYALQTDDERKDFYHVRGMSEALWSGPVTDFISKGRDPFDMPPAEKRSQLREHIREARQGLVDGGPGTYFRTRSLRQD